MSLRQLQQVVMIQARPGDVSARSRHKHGRGHQQAYSGIVKGVK